MGKSDRQSSRAGCTAVSVAVLALLSLLASEAGAEVQVRLVVSPEQALAPATVVLTASTSSSDPIIAYRWTGAGIEPACAQAECSVRLAVASCRRVEVEVTTVFGEPARASVQACASDETGAPPRAELVISPEGAVSAVVTPGTARIAKQRFWIDAAEVASGARLDRAAGCQVIDLLVVDARGRIATDQRQVCREDAPRVRLAGAPDPIVPRGATHRICSAIEHPLGLPVERRAGDVPLDACTRELEAPGQLVRHVLQVRDSAGVESTASLLTFGAPSSGEPLLLFASLSDPRDLHGADVWLNAEIHGGNPPFSITARLSEGSSGGVLGVVREDGDPRQLSLIWSPVPRGSLDRTAFLEIEDRDGLTATASIAVRIAPQDWVPGDGGPSQAPSAQDGIGCSTARAPAADVLASFALLSIVALLFRRRR